MSACAEVRDPCPYWSKNYFQQRSNSLVQDSTYMDKRTPEDETWRIFGPGARNSLIKAYEPWVQGEDIVHCSLYMSLKGRYQSIVSHLVYPIQGLGSRLQGR
jgi:hypothetical protein